MSQLKQGSAMKSLMAQYSDSEDGSGEESENQEEQMAIGDELGESISNPPSVKTDPGSDIPRNPTISYLAASQPSSQSNSPSSIFGNYVSHNSPSKYVTIQASPQPPREDFPLDEEDRPTDPVSFHQTLEGLDPDQIQIPPAPPKRCTGKIVEKMINLKQKKDEGLDLVQLIQKRKDFRNPSIYQKLIEHCGIAEFGTNFSPEFYDPHKWSSESYYEKLSSAQKDLMDRLEKEKRDKSTKIEMVVGTKTKSSSSTNNTSSASSAPSDPPRRHHHDHHSSSSSGRNKASKWDVPGSGVSGKSHVGLPSVVHVSSSSSSKPSVTSVIGTSKKK